MKVFIGFFLEICVYLAFIYIIKFKLFSPDLLLLLRLLDYINAIVEVNRFVRVLKEGNEEEFPFVSFMCARIIFQRYSHTYIKVKSIFLTYSMCFVA